MKKPIPFGKYLLLDRVAVGGMAEVYKAKATGVQGFERFIAIKRILPNIAEDDEFITMFIDEAKIAVQLQHANIAQIYDLGKIQDSYFIAMEYIPGKDVRAIFDRGRRRGEVLPIPLSCYVVSKVSEGLDYAHRKKDAAGSPLNIVHRDISPQNLLCSFEGEVKLIDFGIAKAANRASRTQAGILKGKFGYMSPEQVRGLPLDRRSDVFALGVCLYELLTGERLFVGESDFSVLEKVRAVDVVPPTTYNRRIDETLEGIVMKALSKDVDDRYQWASELGDDLQRFLITTDSIFSRTDLAAFMKSAFAEDLEKEKLRSQIGTEEPEPVDDDPFADMDIPIDVEARTDVFRPSVPAATQLGVSPAPLPGIPMAGQAAVPPPPNPFGGGLAALEGDGGQHITLPGGIPAQDIPMPPRPVMEVEPDMPLPPVPAEVGGENTKKFLIAGLLALLLVVGGGAAAMVLMSNSGSGTGVLIVRGKPIGGSVFVNGQRVGKLPYIDAKQPVGNYVVRVEADEHISSEERVSVLPDETARLEVELEKEVIRASVLVVSSPLDTKVIFDGKVVKDGGDAPWQSREIEPRVSHSIVVKKTNFRDVSFTWTPEPGQNKTFTAKLVSSLANLVVRSKPPGARVTLDGAPMGVTPVTIRKVDATRQHALEVVKKCFHPWTSTILYDSESVEKNVNAILKADPTCKKRRRRGRSG